MTDAQERAKAVAEQVEELRVMDHEGTTLNKREIEAMLADQLAQVEAETWEQAAKVTREMADLHRKVGNYEKSAALYAMAEAFDVRYQQAQRAKEGKG